MQKVSSKNTSQIKNTRHIFFEILEKLMEIDKDIIFLTGDLGYSYVEEIQYKFPDQFINCGCMEQSMIDIAVGLSLAGKKPYVYSTLNFLLFRALEQVRNDIVCMKSNVKLIGVGISGFLGFSHNRLHEKEDINICKNIGLKYFVPKTKGELTKILNNEGQFYVRI
jgi:transketolase